MERLTERSIGCFGYDLINADHSEQEFGNYDAFYNYSMAVKKLGEYEDAEEQGLLLRLPCKVGDKIYRFWYVCNTAYRIQEHTIKTLSHVVALMEDGAFGDTAFLTKQEAERALAKMKGE